MSAERTPLGRLHGYLQVIRKGSTLGLAVASPACDEMAEDLDAYAEEVAAVQDLIRGLRELEGYLTLRMGRVVRDVKAERQGTVEDGRQWSLHRTRERKGWDHEEWKRAARRVVVAKLGDRFRTDDLGPMNGDLIDTETGEAASLGEVLQATMTAIQEFHGAAAPRTGTLKAQGLDPDDYCQSVPGNWKLDIIAPTTTTEENQPHA